MNKYHINLFFSEEDQAWVADIPDLFICSATGDTPEEALHEVLIGQRLWLAQAEKEGKPIPEPHYKPEDTLVRAEQIERDNLLYFVGRPQFPKDNRRAFAM